MAPNCSKSASFARFAPKCFTMFQKCFKPPFLERNEQLVGILKKLLAYILLHLIVMLKNGVRRPQSALFLFQMFHDVSKSVVE